MGLAVKRSRRVAFVCSHCGSSDVTIDAWAVWNAETQAWELGGTLDYTHCETCDEECRIEEILQ